MLSVAEILSKYHDVVVLSNSSITLDQFRQRYEEIFQLDLSRIRLQTTSLGTPAHVVKKLMESARYDVLYYQTNGSFFFSVAKRNIVNIQFPFMFPMNGLVDRLKLQNWKVRNVYSNFTKRVIEHTWNIPIQYVHYPYVDTSRYFPMKKESIILSVGRFFTGEKSGAHCKRQDILVEAFKQFMKKVPQERWRLVLVGSIDPGKDNEAYATRIADMAKGFPIKILHDATFNVLRQYYAHATVYWHAAGYGIDESREPTKVEHFGISTVEAMSSGAIPIVIGKGGQKEIIEDKKNGFLCETIDDIVENTYSVIKNDTMKANMQKQARERAQYFNKEKFEKTLLEMIS